MIDYDVLDHRKLIGPYRFSVTTTSLHAASLVVCCQANKHHHLIDKATNRKGHLALVSDTMIDSTPLAEDTKEALNTPTLCSAPIGSGANIRMRTPSLTEDQQ